MAFSVTFCLLTVVKQVIEKWHKNKAICVVFFLLLQMNHFKLLPLKQRILIQASKINEQEHVDLWSMKEATEE